MGKYRGCSEVVPARWIPGCWGQMCSHCGHGASPEWQCLSHRNSSGLVYKCRISWVPLPCTYRWAGWNSKAQPHQGLTCWTIRSIRFHGREWMTGELKPAVGVLAFPCMKDLCSRTTPSHSKQPRIRPTKPGLNPAPKPVAVSRSVGTITLPVLKMSLMSSSDTEVTC